MQPSWHLLDNCVVLVDVQVPAAWLALATGAPWQDGEKGLVLLPWDADGFEPEHTRRRLAARARQALSCLSAWPGRPESPPLDPSRVLIQPVDIPSRPVTEGELPILQPGFELQIADELATMADLAEAIDRFAAASPWARTRSPVAITTCEGCPQCCAEPVPVSSVDLMLLARANHTPHLGQEGDATGCMVPVSDGYCAFLDRETRRCTVHSLRPWVCRAYFCCPEGPVSEAVRDELLGHILASTLDWGVDTPLRHVDDYRKVLLIDLVGELAWNLAHKPESRN